MAGVHYDGGGIARTVSASRAATLDDLRRGTQKRIAELFTGGVTTVEIKSGYELTTEGEIRELEVAGEFSDEVTWLGAHVVPPEFKNNREGYVELLCSTMIDSCVPLARWADVFSHRGA